MSSKTGSFALNTSTGNQSVSGLGFQPKAIIFIGNNLTADGGAANAYILLGMAVSSSSRVAHSFFSIDFLVTSDGGKSIVATKCISMSNASDTVILDADFVTMDADGFTINITTTDGVAYIMNYIALGGSDLTNVAIFNGTTKTTTGSQAYTGLGFQPDAMFLLCSSAATLPLTNNSALGGLGVASSGSAEGALGIRMGATVTPQITEKTQKTPKIMDTSNGGAIFYSADVTSFDSDGFTFNYSTATGTARNFFALCLKGGQFKVGAFNQSTSTGNQAVTDPGFQPNGLVLFSWNAATSSSILEDSRTTIGAADSASSRFTTWAGDQDNVAVTECNSILDRDKIIGMYNHPGTLQTEADLVSFDSGGFTINNSTVDATAREIVYMAFGSNAGGAVRLFLSSQGAGT